MNVDTRLPIFASPLNSRSRKLYSNIHTYHWSPCCRTRLSLWTKHLSKISNALCLSNQLKHIFLFAHYY